MHIHLMEPYRSAFVAKCLEESLITFDPPELSEIAAQAPGISTCGTPELMGDALQLTVLASEVSMVWTEIGSVPKERGLPHMKLSGLENLGVVNLIGEYPLEIAAQEKARWQGLDNLDELWDLEKEEIDALSPIILSQMQARGKPIHWSLFRLLRACRLHEDKAIPIILSTVPAHLEKAAKSILSIEPRLMHEYDMPIIFTLQELRLTTATATKQGARLAGAAPKSVNGEEQEEVGKAATQLWGLVVEELLGEEIDFPIPSNVREVISLRGCSEILDFRNLLIPFMESLLKGEENTTVSLRKSIKSCVKAFKRFPVTKRLARWTGYASLGVGAVEAATGLIGISIGTGMVALGFEALAKKWQSQSSWLWLAKTNTA